MATLMSSGCRLRALLPSQLSSNSRRGFLKLHGKPIFKRGFAAKIRASSSFSSSTLLADSKPTDSVVVEEEEEEISASRSILACPICFEPFSLISDRVVTLGYTPGSSLQCNTCKKTYSAKETHLELVAATGAKLYDNFTSFTTEFFRLPLISFLYERGWRQNFALGGFPGPEKEFELIKDYLKPVLGGNIVDASCGSGLFSRLFAKSGLFSFVVALDYSENMLQQCYEFIKQDKNFPKENLTLVRADISRLPFASGSVDAVHAGAAIHCWPSPSMGVAEVSRVLRPGGVFVGTTGLWDGPFNVLPLALLRPVRQNLAQISGSHFFLREGELEDICRACGLADFRCTRNRQFIMFSATKPS